MFGKLTFLLIASSWLAAAESRFGLPVAGLETPKEFRFLELTGNKFAMAQHGDAVVAAVVYGGPWRYFVDVAVSNRGTKPLRLVEDFARFHKNGTAVAPTDTRMIAAEMQRALEQGSAKVTPANYAGDLKAMQQRAVLAKEQNEKRDLITHVSAFAREKQSLELAPGKMTLYTFVFHAPDRDKMGFELCVVAGDSEFKYEFKK
jgi:hypothetical protein